MSRVGALLRPVLRRLARYAGAASWPLPERFALAGGAFAAADREVLERLPQQSVLVLAPHPDDEVIGLGGALAHYADNGSPVTVVYVTDGGGTEPDRQALVERRRREAEAVGALAGIVQIFWSHSDTRLDPDAALPDLVELLEHQHPQVVYLPSFFEHHVDHYATNVLLARALARADCHPAIVGYEIWDALPSPNLLLDITDVLERKAEMMRLYEAPLEVTDFEALIRHRAALHYLLYVDSTRRRRGAAEAYLALSAPEFQQRFAAWDRSLRRLETVDGADAVGE